MNAHGHSANLSARLPAMLLTGARTAVLLLFGGLLLNLVASGQLWRFLNPRFEPLIGVSGGALLLLGVFLPFAAPARGSIRAAQWIPVLALALFLALAGHALRQPLEGHYGGGYQSDSMADDLGDWKPSGQDLFYADQAPDSPRLEWNGSQWVKMNTAELVLLSEQGRVPERVALRGKLARIMGPDGSEHWALVRLSVVCCLADAVGMGVELSGPIPEVDLSTGWVRVLGRPVAAEPALRTGDVPLPGAVVTILAQGMVLEVADLGAAEPPDMPFVFEFRQAEPFAW